MLVRIGSNFCVAHLSRQVVLGTSLANETLLSFAGALIAHYLTLNLRTQRVERLDSALAFLIDNMPSVLGADRRTDLSGLHGEGGIFKLLNHHTLTKPTEVTAAHAAAAVVGQLLCQFGKVICVRQCGN